MVPATLCHAPIFARTAAPVPAPRSAPLCLGVSGWRPSSPRPLRPGIRNDHERSFTYGTRTPRSRWCSHGTRTPRSRWCSHAPRHIAQPVSLALLHRHCTTGTAPLALHHGSLATWRTTLDAQHDRLHSMHDTSRRSHCALSLCRLLPSTISVHHYAFSLSVGYSHPPSPLFHQDHALARYSQSFSFSKTRDLPLLRRPLLVAVSQPPLVLLMPRSALSPLALPSHPSPCSLTRGSTPRVRVARRDLLVETLTNPLAGLSSPLAVLLDVD